jgi:hypothetical protein
MEPRSADVSEEPELFRLDTDEDTSSDRRHGRRALWISVGLLVGLVAIAVPVIVYLTRPTPARVHTPSQVAGLTRDTQSNATSTAEYLRSAVAAGLNLGSSVGAVYTDGSGDAHSVIFVGGSTTTGSTNQRLRALFGLLDDGTDGVAAVTRESPGALGGEVNCAITTDSSVSDAASAESMAVCGWADSGSVGLALFPNRSVAEAVALFGRMRPALEDSQ